MGSQAQSVGIQEGDIIIKYLENEVKSSKELIEIVNANANINKDINIKIIRNGTPIEMSVSPGKIGIRIDTVDLSQL